MVVANPWCLKLKALISGAFYTTLFTHINPAQAAVKIKIMIKTKIIFTVTQSPFATLFPVFSISDPAILSVLVMAYSLRDLISYTRKFVTVHEAQIIPSKSSFFSNSSSPYFASLLV